MDLFYDEEFSIVMAYEQEPIQNICLVENKFLLTSFA